MSCPCCGGRLCARKIQNYHYRCDSCGFDRQITDLVPWWHEFLPEHGFAIGNASEFD